MFYLIQFFKSLGDSLFRGFAFFLLSCLLAFSLTHRPWIAKTVEAITPEKMVNPYFVTVMDGSVSPEKVRLTASGLPGVLGVTSLDGEGQSKLQNLVSSLGPDYTVDSNLMNFRSFRILLNPSLSAESLDFIRGQIVKAGGSEHMTASEIKYPEVTSVMNAHPFYRFLGKAGDWGIIAVLAVLWIISFWLAYDVFRSHSYLVEKFQRRKFVAAKTIATGLGLIVISFSALAIFNGTLKFFDLILLMMVFSVFWTFSMQEWRWKA